MTKKIELEWGTSGFQIGGYYSPVHFEVESDNIGNSSCIEMVIHSDGQFPTEEPEGMLSLHLCDFEQLENFVKVWGDKLRADGIIPPKAD